jgi:copper resistance protein D
MTADTVYTVLRFVFDASALLLWGSAVYLRMLVAHDLAKAVWQQIAPFRRLAVWLILAATLAALPLRTAMLGNGWADLFALPLMRDILVGTSIGTAWIWQAVGAVALGLGSLLPEPRARMTATAIAAGFLLVGLATIGHAAMHSGAIGSAHRLSDALHVLSAGAWTGSLLPVFVILSPRWISFFPQEARRALIRFSTAGHVAVAIALLSGAINTLLIVGGPPIDWAAPYQLLLAIKIALVGLMLALALANRYLLVPRLSRTRRAMAWLRAGTLAEIAIAAFVIALVAVFGMLEPFP